ncbi:hypothetical protein COV15_01730 [Candidatus Woesearchaeota archaeon CG10_big_fil_rev_8_21_14_0_10_34_12]|nr:MAG: hypothetical protein COV15_01730 [Candidatus Woesearchaeota archaeon CG10_big_fil_rev_8_21_14_0_10_34_12]
MTLLTQLESSKEFKKFREENKTAYLCAEFLILDFETNKDSFQIDYSLEDEKIATFSLGEKVEMQICENLGKNKLEEIKNINLSPEEIKEAVVSHLKNKQVTKIIAVLQNLGGEEIWNLTCITKGLAIIRLKIRDSDSWLLEEKDTSLFDIVKRVK